MSFYQQFQQLPPQLQAQVADYVACLLQRYASEFPAEAQSFSFAWSGALKDRVADQNGVDLQHEAGRLRG